MRSSIVVGVTCYNFNVHLPSRMRVVFYIYTVKHRCRSDNLTALSTFFYLTVDQYTGDTLSIVIANPSCDKSLDIESYPLHSTRHKPRIARKCMELTSNKSY